MMGSLENSAKSHSAKSPPLNNRLTHYLHSKIISNKQWRRRREGEFIDNAVPLTVQPKSRKGQKVSFAP